MTENEARNGPVAKAQVGSFQISLWKREKVYARRTEFESERRIEFSRVLVQHSRFNRKTGAWQSQGIWCNPDELRDLAQALGEFPVAALGVAGRAKPASLKAGGASEAPQGAAAP